jgi:2-polyprenyl-3-methyl-5-hydroxy-6-metoxy-1,4-benzoquinol methylase
VTSPPTHPLRTVCDVCHAPGQPWLSRQGRRLVRCSSCGFTWVPEGLLRTPRGLSIYEDDERNLFEEQADYYRDASAADAARAKLAWVSRFVRPGARLLDVGANFGNFVRQAMDQFDAIGIEPSSATVAWAQKHLNAAVQVGSIFEEMPAFVGRFDAVTMFDVIEHLENPADAVRQCRRYLAPGGKLFVSTPDMGSLVARLLGREWYYVDLDQHISMFATANLTRFLGTHGFRVTDRRSFGRRYRFSYIERRLRDLGQENGLLRLAHLFALPLRLAPERRVSINLRDVVGLVAEKDD